MSDLSAGERADDAVAVDAFRSALAIARAVRNKDLRGPSGAGEVFNAAERKDLVVWALGYLSVDLARRACNTAGLDDTEIDHLLETVVYEAAVFEIEN